MVFFLVPIFLFGTCSLIFIIALLFTREGQHKHSETVNLPEETFPLLRELDFKKDREEQEEEEEQREDMESIPKCYVQDESHSFSIDYVKPPFYISLFSNLKYPRGHSVLSQIPPYLIHPLGCSISVKEYVNFFICNERVSPKVLDLGFTPAETLEDQENMLQKMKGYIEQKLEEGAMFAELQVYVECPELNIRSYTSKGYLLKTENIFKQSFHANTNSFFGRWDLFLDIKNRERKKEHVVFQTWMDFLFKLDSSVLPTPHDSNMEMVPQKPQPDIICHTVYRQKNPHRFQPETPFGHISGWLRMGAVSAHRVVRYRAYTLLTPNHIHTQIEDLPLPLDPYITSNPETDHEMILCSKGISKNGSKTRILSHYIPRHTSFIPIRVKQFCMESAFRFILDIISTNFEDLAGDVPSIALFIEDKSCPTIQGELHVTSLDTETTRSAHTKIIRTIQHKIKYCGNLEGIMLDSGNLSHEYKESPFKGTMSEIGICA